MKKVIKIDGMGCEHCVKSVKSALESLAEIKVIEVKIGEAIVDMPIGFDFDVVIKALDDAGYDVISVK